MSRKTILFYAILVIGIGTTYAQKEIECKAKLSISHESVKTSKYDEAYEPWLFVRNNCPELNLATYADGEKILKHKIDSAKEGEKKSFIEDLIALWQERKQYFSSSTPIGEYDAKACQLQYDYNDELSKSKDVLYDCFNAAFKADKQSFTHPKSLYSYFSLMVDLFDEGKKTDTELFNTYDDVSEKIQVEIQNYSEKLNALVLRIESGETLSKKDIGRKKAYESYLKNYTLIQENIDNLSNARANCNNLIPLYSKDFNTHQNDSVWLKRAVSRIYYKQCTEDELYETLVKQYDNVAPSADTKVYVATVLLKKEKDEEAYQYLEEAYRLETDAYKKSNLAFRIGVIYKNKGHYSKARTNLLDALKLNPSNGKPHLLIAEMYNDSAKNCGKDNFHQRAVYWLAAQEAEKASRVDPTLQKWVNQAVANYEAKAPTKEEIFLSGLAGKTLKIGCWINRSIMVPKLD
ncbi:tetratricopeptide repeat protein [Winogradskyella pulchriflava]|uniref:Tetratricopeptide repeat protein n=1 Tax=Winogradskyella pulchriflava TaxID=1110688 RepID=A0ABV6Q619_9FLAO